MTQKIGIPQLNSNKTIFVVVFQRLKLIDIGTEIFDLRHAELVYTEQKSDNI